MQIELNGEHISEILNALLTSQREAFFQGKQEEYQKSLKTYLYIVERITK